MVVTALWSVEPIRAAVVSSRSIRQSTSPVTCAARACSGLAGVWSAGVGTRARQVATLSFTS
ncbi:hypothetical protein DYH09_10490 [bacterium CPR1]|nr:hypothetical protein [bacterium CPR1]